jgi:cytidylate kinase
MKEISPFAITISRQVGSGGAYLGKRLAARLNVLYLDREIVRQAAKELKMPVESLEARDEKLTPFWQSLLESYVDITPVPYVPPPLHMPTGRKLYRTESNIITQIAQQRSAVIVGRGGYYVLRRHPRRLSILLHADVAFRQKRVQELYHVSTDEALKLIESVDKEREHYLRALTGQNCMDARHYHLSLDTSLIGLEAAEEIIMAAFRARSGGHWASMRCHDLAKC